MKLRSKSASSQQIQSDGLGFGTLPVFLASISTILGAILFLRFGYAVGHVGLLGALAIILIGHAVTIPTGLAVAEIATNLKVEGGGAYYIISRSFGTTVGGAIGVALYVSQAISIAFYMIAASEACRPLLPMIYERWGFMPDIRMVSIPATLILILIILKKGANLGISLLGVVTVTLGISLLMFFLGKPASAPNQIDILGKISQSDDFFKVFAIIFPAFTGMIAGIGLSGDLKKPRVSIPVGTITATLFGMIVYILVVIKLSYSATPEDLANDQFIMSKIAIWGPAIYIGLGAASLSSAIGSLLVAPRTLQALAQDKIIPNRALNSFLEKKLEKNNEPVNATMVTSIIALIFISMGSIDFVAQIISMFFMITYGTLCAISFIEHFAGNPSYRPSFHSRWYLSLLGAVASFIMMFQMQPVFAALSLGIMAILYMWINSQHKGEADLAASIQGALFQLTRYLQVVTQQKQSTSTQMVYWRPAMVAISDSSFTRLAPFDILRWIGHHYGFGMYMHYIKDMLNEETNQKAEEISRSLISQTQISKAGIFVDTIISPSFTTAIAQIVQMPSVTGMKNNSILFEFSANNEELVQEIINGSKFANTVGYNICILRSGERHFGYKQHIHIWTTPNDFKNAKLMILLAYIILGHPDWKGGQISLYAAIKETNMEVKEKVLFDLIDQGRIPISANNVNCIPYDGNNTSYDELVSEYSKTADLVFVGISLQKLMDDQGAFLTGFKGISDIMFIKSGQELQIADDIENDSIIK